MENNFIIYIHDFLKNLIKVYGFTIEEEVNAEDTYYIQYSSSVFVIKLEKYRREFYVTFYKSNTHNKEINLFNLLDYLNQNKSNIQKAEYFKDEENVDECYKKQLKYLSCLIYDNYSAIHNFFNNNNYESNFTYLENFIISKHPELFKR